MIPRDTSSPAEYRLPLTPEGAVEFLPDDNGVEQVDFRLSTLDHMTRDAIDMAQTAQPANPERTETRRGEFGEQAIGLFAALTHERPLEITDPRVMLAQSAHVYEFRQSAIRASAAELDGSIEQKAA